MNTVDAQKATAGTKAAKLSPRLGEILLRKGVISQTELDRALAAQAVERRPLGEILFGLTDRSRFTICEALAELLGVEWVRPDRMEISQEILDVVSPGLAGHYEVIPVGVEGGKARVATAMPQAMETLDELGLLIGMPVLPVLAMQPHIREGIKKHYGVGAETIERMRSIEEDAVVLDDKDQQSLEDETGDASIIRFVNQIIVDAHRLSATDIHFEPGEGSFRIRYRVDGLLEEVRVPPDLVQYQAAIISRIKVMARLDIAEQRLPQDGRIQVRMAGESFDLRVSMLPTPLGEGVNLRLLRRGNAQLDLEALGYSDASLKTLMTSVRQPNGIILITGPTGSGKTTSLYALLAKINTTDKKIITIEDPIEYRLPGLLQMQVHEQVGFTFARALRSILRHDPDVVLVGEIRDPETAEIAIRMAMTGHLVLSTLHTNDAASSIARLIDMGVEPYLLATTILCVVAQRLIRKVCVACGEPYQPEKALLDPFVRAQLPMPHHFFRGKGCEQCRNSGYLGRTGIHEIIPVDDAVQQLILDKAAAASFRALARKKGIRLMQEEGWDRACSGQTTLDEILRVTQSIEV